MEPDYDIKKLPPKARRLAKEHIELHELCKRSDKISYEIVKRVGKMPPTIYRITYKVKSIIGVDENKMPIYGDHHVVELKIPTGYPTESIIPFAVTDIWHPNIRWVGELKGRICTTSKHLSAGMPLDMLVVRIGEIIQYKNYLAENVEPYPEDVLVAEWVRTVAEPKGIVNYKEEKAIDNSDLLKPLPGFEPRNTPDPNDLEIDQTPVPEEKQSAKPTSTIVIKKRTSTIELPKQESMSLSNGKKITIRVRKKE